MAGWVYIRPFHAPVVKLVDTQDSGSCASNGVMVRLHSGAPPSIGRLRAAFFTREKKGVEVDKKETILLDARLLSVIDNNAFDAELRNGHRFVAFFKRGDTQEHAENR